MIYEAIIIWNGGKDLWFHRERSQHELEQWLKALVECARQNEFVGSVFCRIHYHEPNETCNEKCTEPELYAVGVRVHQAGGVS